MPEPIFMNLGMNIMEPEHISAAYFINPSHQSLCLLSLVGNGSAKCNPPFDARQRLGKHVSTATNIRKIEELWNACVDLSVFVPIVAR
jgi:hypothetical protein